MQNWNTITVLQSGSCTTKKNIYIQVLGRSLRQSHTHIHTCTHTHTHTCTHTHTYTHTHSIHTAYTHTNAIYIHIKHTYEDTHLLFLAGRAWFWTLQSSEPSWASWSLHLIWDWTGRDRRWGSIYNHLRMLVLNERALKCKPHQHIRTKLGASVVYNCFVLWPRDGTSFRCSVIFRFRL